MADLLHERKRYVVSRPMSRTPELVNWSFAAESPYYSKELGADHGELVLRRVCLKQNLDVEDPAGVNGAA
jgi:hypothetical protein